MGTDNASLTPREREALQLLAEGHRNKEIVKRLRPSVKTAETHCTAVMHEIGAETISDAARYAICNHIISG